MYIHAHNTKIKNIFYHPKKLSRGPTSNPSSYVPTPPSHTATHLLPIIIGLHFPKFHMNSNCHNYFLLLLAIYELNLLHVFDNTWYLSLTNYNHLGMCSFPSVIFMCIAIMNNVDRHLCMWLLASRYHPLQSVIHKCDHMVYLGYIRFLITF